MSYFNLHQPFKDAARHVTDEAVDEWLGPDTSRPYVKFKNAALQSLQRSIHEAILNLASKDGERCKSDLSIPMPKFDNAFDPALREIAKTCLRLNGKIIAIFPEPEISF